MNKKILIIYFEIIITIIGLILFLRLNELNTELYVKIENRFDMLQSADELKHSSDDLTHFARSYVISANEIFKEQYIKTLKIRNGEISRPFLYNSIYWDLNENIRKQRHPDAEKKALKDILSALPFSSEEIAKLTLSEKNLNNLVNLEIRAFKAMQDNNQALAIKLLHSTKYYQTKHEIMNPVDEFIIMVNKRTIKDMNRVKYNINLTYVYMFMLSIIFVFINYIIFKYIKNSLQRTIDEKTFDLQNINEKLEIKIQKAILENSKHNQQLVKQSRLAQMGEMISMIAHQWRQPLAAISANSIDLSLKIELESFDIQTSDGRKEAKKYFFSGLKKIDSLVQSLTSTIDDFRNFYKPNKKQEICLISVPVQKAYSIIEASLAFENIEVIQKYDSTKKVNIYSNELMQVILNILQNAKDNFNILDIKNAQIIIEVFDLEASSIICVCDNGGGINEDIIGRIFDPYFSTKNEKNATGLGLYMSKIIVEEHHNGILKVENTKSGVCFKIELFKED